MKELIKTSQSLTTFLPPNDTELEKVILGAVLLDFKALNRVEGIVTPKKFFDPRNELVMEAILKLKSENLPIDILTVVQTLRKSKQITNVGGAVYIAELTNRVSSTANLEVWALQLTEMYLKRELAKSASRIAELALSAETDPFEIYNEFSAELTDLIRDNLKGQSLHVSTITPETTESIEAREKTGVAGIPTGIQAIDNVLGGHQKSDLVYIAARPGMGKTSFAISVMLNMAEKGKPVAFFSLEMSRVQIVFRMASILSGLNAEQLAKHRLDKETKVKYYQTVDRLNALPIFIDDNAALSVYDLKTRVRTLREKHKIEAVFIDYVQLISAAKSKTANREQEVSAISRGLKLIAKENNLPVIALAQLSRSLETRSDKRPMLSDLRDSGSLEQDADVVSFLYRADYYDKNSGINNAEFIIAKHRNGRTGFVNINFTPETMHYSDTSKAINYESWEL
jgi:replicative DNA helicase